MQEKYDAPLRFWLSAYAARYRSTVAEAWSVSDHGRQVLLRITAGRTRRLIVRARWKVAIPLDHPTTKAQLVILAGPHGLVPDNGAARHISYFPAVAPRSGDSVELEGRVLVVDPSQRRMQVAIVPAGATDPTLVVRHGRDLNLLAGYQLIRRTQPPPFTWLTLPPGIPVALAQHALDLHQFGSFVTRNVGAPLIVRWDRAGRLSLGDLLRHAPAAVELIAPHA